MALPHMADPSGGDWEGEMVAALSELKAAQADVAQWPRNSPVRAVAQRRLDRAVDAVRELAGHPRLSDDRVDVSPCCSGRPFLMMYPE